MRPYSASSAAKGGRITAQPATPLRPLAIRTHQPAAAVSTPPRSPSRGSLAPVELQWGDVEEDEEAVEAYWHNVREAVRRTPAAPRSPSPAPAAATMRRDSPSPQGSPVPLQAAQARAAAAGSPAASVAAPADAAHTPGAVVPSAVAPVAPVAQAAPLPPSRISLIDVEEAPPPRAPSPPRPEWSPRRGPRVTLTPRQGEDLGPGSGMLSPRSRSRSPFSTRSRSPASARSTLQHDLAGPGAPAHELQHTSPAAQAGAQERTAPAPRTSLDAFSMQSSTYTVPQSPLHFPRADVAGPAAHAQQQPMTWTEPYRLVAYESMTKFTSPRGECLHV